MIQSLADQHHIGPRVDQLFEPSDAIGFQLRLQLVLKIFFAKQIQAVTADTT